MTEPKRPSPAETDASAVPAAPNGAEVETPPDFFVGDDEHDGWGPIVKRRTPPPQEPNR